MTNYELLTILIAIGALLVSILALWKSGSAGDRANQIAEENLKLVHAQVEIDLRNQIIESRRNVEEFYTSNGDFLSRPVTSLSDEERAKRERLKTAVNSLLEGYLSALDEACQKYIDGKIDKVRFKKGYQREIRQAVQGAQYKAFFETGHAFNALMRIYEEWENPEKT